MNIFTMYVGQGELVVVRHAGEAIMTESAMERRLNVFCRNIAFLALS
jgi:hypothetical protein